MSFPLFPGVSYVTAEEADRLRRSRTMVVHYNEKDPSQCVLFPGIRLSSNLYPMIIGGFMLLGATLKPSWRTVATITKRGL